MFNGLAGLNVVGLRRAGFDARKRQEIKELFRLLFRNEKPFQEAVAEAEKREWSAESQVLLEFVRCPSKKGVLSMKKACAEQGFDAIS
jgi:UDP-N-acetylglucosamine acyltransferase